MRYFKSFPNIDAIISKVLNGVNLRESEAYILMSQIEKRNMSLPLIKDLLLSLQKKVETVDEITGFAKALRKNCVRVNAKSFPLVDICGTGGDAKGTFNVSTVASFIAAGAGVIIAKHGNVSISSSCGSADVMRALGINIYLKPWQIARCIDEIGIGFIFAPFHHPTYQYVADVRKEIGSRTVFNILGPLINPALPKRQVLGVYDSKLVMKIGNVLKRLGSKRAFVAYGSDGLDELSTLGITEIADLNFGIITYYGIDSERFGIKRVSLQDIKGGKPSDNAKIIFNCLDSKISSPYQDIALLNASAAIVVAGLAVNLKEGLELAKQSLCSGKARLKLAMLKILSNELSTA